MSTFSVVIPCYNYGKYLGDCVGSVLSQGGVDLRILVIDDASPDNTAEVAGSLAALDRRVEFRRHEENKGHISTYNEGIEWADGDYFLLLSADDLLTPGALARAADYLDSHADVGFTFGEALTFVGDERPTCEARPVGEGEWRSIPGTEFVEHICELTYNPVPTPTAVVRTGLQKRLGGYRHDLPHSGDLEMWLRFAAYSSVGIVAHPQAHQRKHSRNMNRDYRGILDMEQRRDAFRVFFRDHGHRLQDRDRLRDTSIRKLAGVAFWDACHAFERDDLPACHELLRFSRGLDPAIEARPEWSRMRWKQRMGPKVWNHLRPFMGRLPKIS